jgi:hypothetical protein
MSEKSISKIGWIARKKYQLKQSVGAIVKQPVKVDEIKQIASTATAEIKAIGKGRLLSWKEYSAKMGFRSTQSVQKSHRNMVIFFYVVMLAVVLQILSLMNVFGNLAGGGLLDVKVLAIILLSLSVAINVAIVISRELWMIRKERTISPKAWFHYIRNSLTEFFPPTLGIDNRIAVRIKSNCVGAVGQVTNNSHR